MDKNIREQILSLVDETYRDFHRALCPGVENIAGVRLPQLQKMAKEITKQDDWRDVLLAMSLSDSKECLYEEIMLEGLLIGYCKTDFEDRLSFVEAFVPKIDNWAICDCFSVGLKSVAKHPERMWEFLQFYLYSDQEFMLRFGVVMLLDYFINETYLDRLFETFDRIKHDGYYVNMAIAWAVSICYIKFPTRTMAYLQKNELEDFTYNKALQKIVESTRVSQADKALIRSMKRK